MRNNCINNLLNLKGVIIKNIKNSEKNISVYIETEHHSQQCPHCKSYTSKIKDYHTQSIKDVPIQFKNTTLIVKKRRYECKSCGKTFYEKLDFVPKYYRTTNRLLAYIYDQLLTNKSMKQIAKESNVSSNKIMRTIDLFDCENNTLPDVISIDEFKGNTGYYKYQVSLIDSKNHKILDILPCRYKHDLCNYFKKFPLSERSKVKYFITDLWETYKDISITYFPKAKIIADKFHYSRYIVNAVNDLRIETQKKLQTKEKKYFFHSKKLLLARYINLKEESQDKLRYILINYSEDLRIIYREKEELLDIIHNENSELAKIKFNDWVKRNINSNISILKDVAKTYFNWSYEIKNSLEVHYTNGVIEGFNNKIKTLKRNAFGFRNFRRFRTRILLLT